MTYFDSLYPHLAELGQEAWAEQLRAVLPERLAERLGAVESLPELKPSVIELADSVTIGSSYDLGESTRDGLIAQLQGFHPWRKGPYRFFGVEIDTEWRSDWKWERVVPHIQPLTGRRVLDVGCGNGYHGWRMRGAGAAFVLGIEPFLLSVQQFLVMQHYLRDPRHHVIPVGIEEVPQDMACFDSVFSMGVLYHRRSPLDHLFQLKGCLRPGGELILETLIVEGDRDTVFVPQGRYAKMRNVWFLPSIAALTLWLERCGFTDVACVDTNRTSCQEQRSTEWMRFESLPDFLDSRDAGKTIEGHPAPVRAIFTATRP
ncbi:tRNA U34 carboxymethyltransferase [Geomonas limicola]|uniref:tRNA U34 carboxymethyltransferase n=1 Tax=Geomonas limicola TaxID=2740186 RepID=A0A6V8N9A9_9BACT|nr:tRNA 5-methoxyuridine(34)/uridine 5-oxyacetic acid(34) synthase CmoB [Geomonas limicola]GFO68103.1 tRNA U34 carboxymethyltransferase [Geomonas limicola]